MKMISLISFGWQNGARIFAAAIFAAAQLAFANDAIKVPLQSRQQWNFNGVRFDNDFSGARLNGCAQLGAHDFKVIVSPENEPINPSPWFAFKVSADTAQRIALHFDYTYDGPHGRPWLSADGKNWTRVPTNFYTRGPETNMATLRLDVGKNPVWVAAWDMVGLKEINDWADKICRLPFVKSGSAGVSIENRPLRDFILSATTNKNYVFVIGRQHPPEITGSIGLMSFVDTLAGDSSLARKFCKQFQIVVVPVVNPDGVEHGHWRSNLGGVDLNRDWRDFSQPETVVLRDFILHIASAPGATPELFVDFHSTGTNVFYSVPQAKNDAHQNFTDHWLAALKHDCPKFSFERDDDHNATEATSKAWANAALHVPAITAEFGYSTDRRLVREAARIEAEDMMKLLLADREKTAPGE
jgi:hypothetical protein